MRIDFVKTCRRYLVTKTRCTCMLEMQWRPTRISFVFVIDQMYHKVMMIRRGYRFQLITNALQSECLSCFAGCNRLVWNKALALQKSRLDQHLRALSYEELAGHLITWKQEQPFLKEVHSQPLQQTLKDLEESNQGRIQESKRLSQVQEERAA